MSFKEKREFETLEKEIPKLQELKENLTDKLSQPDLDFEELQKISLELEQTIEKLDEKEMRWLELSLLTED